MRLRSIETPPSFSNLLGKVRHAPAPGLWQGLIEALPTKPLESKEIKGPDNPTCQWGNIEYTISNKHRFTFQHFRRDSHTGWKRSEGPMLQSQDKRDRRELELLTNNAHHDLQYT